MMKKMVLITLIMEIVGLRFVHPNGRIYICQYGGGFSIFKDGKFKIMMKTNGLSDIRIHHMALDSDGNCWLN